MIWGDKLMILFSRALLKETPGATILGEVKCSQTLYDDIAKHGGNPIVWKTGHSLIKTKMKETGALLAGEMSGHLFFADRYPRLRRRDLRVAAPPRIVANDPRPLSRDARGRAEDLHHPELRVDCPDAIKFQVVAAVTKHFRTKETPCSTSTGAHHVPRRRESPEWGLVRASDTGRSSSCASEAGTSAELDTIRSKVESVVKARSGPQLGDDPGHAAASGRSGRS